MQTTQRIKRLPKNGDIDSLFDRLSGYITEIEIGWVQNIKPAKEKTIDSLFKASKIDQKVKYLPKSYRIFLKHMGEDDGGLLKEHLLVDSSASKIYEYYEEENKYEPESINPEMLIFGIFETGSQLSFRFHQGCHAQLSAVRQTRGGNEEVTGKLRKARPTGRPPRFRGDGLF